MQTNFHLGDVLVLMGLGQSLYVLVYILFRAGSVRHIIVPALCFGILSLAFAADLAVPYLEDERDLPWIRLFFWGCVPVFSVLLIGQVADLGRFPRRIYWAPLALPVIAFFCGRFLFGDIVVFQTLGDIFGTVCFLALWLGRKSFADLREDKQTKGERYWLIISFIVMNMLIVAASLWNLFGGIDGQRFVLIRDVLGIGMVYLASTSLLRIYPQAIRLVERKGGGETLSEDDQQLAQKISDLFQLDKVYQEPNFSRADLARELRVSEARISRVVGAHFGKSLPQVINELRIRDSFQLLAQTEAPISVVAEQVGFASLPTFNRVFKDINGGSPSEYRQKNKKS